MASDQSSALYSEAAVELERASGHFWEAAKHIELGERAKASQHAFISHGHLINAEARAHEAATAEAEHYSREVMGAHPVTDAPDDYPA